jgi:ABC-type antimicrobial peptide transport system permease subunit
MSYSVAQRTGEIGLRMALGANRHAVLLLVLKESLLIVLVGICIGLPLAWTSTRLVTSLLYGVTATDTTTLMLATFLLFGAAGVAAFMPARRASSVDPMVALRHE